VAADTDRQAIAILYSGLHASDCLVKTRKGTQTLTSIQVDPQTHTSMSALEYLKCSNKIPKDGSSQRGLLQAGEFYDKAGVVEERDIAFGGLQHRVRTLDSLRCMIEHVERRAPQLTEGYMFLTVYKEEMPPGAHSVCNLCHH
jgi:hypothetical protein